MHEITTTHGGDPYGTPEDRTQPPSVAAHAPSLVGFAGLAAMALLLGISPWSMWPFVITVTLTLCAVILSQNRTTLGVTAIGLVTGALWVIAKAWESGVPSFLGWFIPIASYAVLMLVLHHAIRTRGTRSPHSGAPFRGSAEPFGGEPSSPEPAREIVGGVLRAFDDWHRDWADQGEPWPAFDCFLREQLLERVGAKQVRCFRVVAGGDRFLPLSGGADAADTPDPWNELWGSSPSSLSRASRRGASWQPRPLDANAGIEGHVVATGRAYVQGRSDRGELLSTLAHGVPAEVVWCFPVKRGEEVVGLVRIGHLPRKMLQDDGLLDLTAALLSLCWARVHDVHELGIARRTDLASGVLARSDFLTVAGHALADSQNGHEPAALLIIALEGMRKLDDSAQWASRDRYVHVVGSVLNARLRTDDVIGRFTDDRFAILLRRVDVALGKLIAEKLRQALLEALYSEAAIAMVQEESADADAPSIDNLGVRCALVSGRRSAGADAVAGGAGASHLHDLIGNAFSLLEAARIRKEGVAVERDETDSPSPDEAFANTASGAEAHAAPAVGGGTNED